jgi:hypothetical protein
VDSVAASALASLVGRGTYVPQVGRGSGSSPGRMFRDRR